MTFMPIADRELRVSARSKATRRWRMYFALAGVTIAGALGLISVVSRGMFTSQLGLAIFSALKWIAYVFACGAGVFLTADCLSEEKREGTLGLLFLTDLHGYDVVFGKLLSTSLSGFYGLLAVFPLLAVCLLLGGITNGEFWRMALVLVNAFLFSLAVGIFVS